MRISLDIEGVDDMIKRLERPGKETAWRARFVHDGFVSRNGRFVRGNPFATRAFRLKREAITNAIIREYQKALR